MRAAAFLNFFELFFVGVPSSWTTGFGINNHSTDKIIYYKKLNSINVVHLKLKSKLWITLYDPPSQKKTDLGDKLPLN